MRDRSNHKYINLIDKQIIESLTIIKNTMQAGQSLQNAMFIVKDELDEPLKFEFEYINDKLSLGVDFDEVLANVSKRTKSKEFKLMLDTIRVSKDTGSRLKEIFDRIIDSMIKKMEIKSKMNALTAQGRISGNIISFMPFIVIFITYIIEPDMIKPLFVTLIGNILLFIVVVMILFGSFIIRKMTEIDF
jgi:tight adherence protein B